MPTYLDQIMSRTLLSVLDRKKAVPASLLERRAAAHAPRGFTAALRRAAAQGPAMIAEMKKASPSKGVLREDYRPRKDRERIRRCWRGGDLRADR